MAAATTKTAARAGSGDDGGTARDGGAGQDAGIDWSEFEGAGVDTITGILHTNVVATDIQRSLAFYRDLLKGKVFAGGPDQNPGSALALGLEGTVDFEGYLLSFGQTPMFLDLVQYSKPKVTGKPYQTVNHAGISRLRFGVQDVDAFYQELQAQGADLLGAPRDQEMFGRQVRTFMLRDPDGTFLEFAQADQTGAARAGSGAKSALPDVAPILEGIAQVVLVVSNLDSSLRYYRDVLGGEVVAEGSGEREGEGTGEAPGLEGTIRWREYLLQFDTTNTLIHLIEYESPESVGRAYQAITNTGVARICFNTDDIETSYQGLISLGVEFLAPPQEVNLLGLLPLRACFFKDPDGAMLEFVEVKGSN